MKQKQMTLQIPEEIHRKLKAYVAKTGRTLRVFFLEAALEKFAAERKKGAA
jgi:hypothetical protein